MDGHKAAFNLHSFEVLVEAVKLTGSLSTVLEAARLFADRRCPVEERSVVEAVEALDGGLLTKAQTAQLLGFSQRYVTLLMAAGLPYLRFGTSSVPGIDSGN